MIRGGKKREGAIGFLHFINMMSKFNPFLTSMFTTEFEVLNLYHCRSISLEIKHVYINEKFLIYFYFLIILVKEF